ncbi:uncharacterized protein BP5553_07320 [Venustampulla echinocandica]|uniref:Mid2 domain-containing protein n=1 Tax=Venustampulla echinocandica TaxID=2656787 RepID=A0A370TJ56_9HELO|nr:uncharacterized protein BP5553_07320 [Venustampulla echinocandica]RDL35389.1 hypothetical protein BP5553_07320 [Venustampulla echinocandica]
MHYSVSKSRLAIWLFWASSSAAWAQTIQNILWNVPDGKLSDLSQTFTAGTTLPLSWNALVTTANIDTTENLVDLWATSYDTNLNPFSQPVTQNINLTSPGNYAWTIAIPDKTLAISAKYVLRFKPASSTYDINTGKLSSPGFIVLRGALSTFSTSSSSTSAVTTSSPLLSSSQSRSIAGPSTYLPSQTPTTNQSSTSGGLDSGAKVGVGIGVAVAVLGIFVIIYFFFTRRQGRDATPTEAIMPIGTQENYKVGYTTSPAELPGARHVAEHATELPT